MLNVFFRRAARLTHAPFSGLAALLAYISLTGMPMAHGAEVAPPEETVAVPFKQYQGWRDEPLQDWRKANDRVGEIGGWRTYLRESQPAGDTDQGQHGHPGH